MQLTATTIFSSLSFFSKPFKHWIQANQWMMWVSIIGSFAFLFASFAYSKSFPKNYIFLSGFTAFEACKSSRILITGIANPPRLHRAGRIVL